MKKIVVFASGRGSNCRNIYQKLQIEKKLVQIVNVITDRPNAAILDWAKEIGIPTNVILPRSFDSEDSFSNTLLKVIGEVDLIVLAGYLKKIPSIIVEKFPLKIVNIHPALLPAFGGKGYYGMRVHQAVYEYGAKVSGITIHFVDNEYDHGPILFQKAVDISHCASPEEIAQEVLKVEHKYYSKIIENVLYGKFHLKGRRVIWEKFSL